MAVETSGFNEAFNAVVTAVEGAAVGTALELGSRLIERTPVDTGYARNSWLVTTDPNDAGDPGAVDLAANIASISADFTLGTPLYINNGAAYIGRLNDGHSAQAPAGFVDRTAAEADGIVADQMRDAL